MSFLKEFQHLQISLKGIKSATNNFGETNRIGRGGFGMVYRGELVISEKLTVVAVKRLNTALGQGAPEFWREIMLLSQYKHENLVSLLGFCDEGGESILVYEFLPNKSLDLYLSSPNLSWNQRLRLCIGAARGLQYLHEPAEGSQHRVLHRDIKSANILLDHNWNAKIADFGLSKFGPANQQFTYQLTAPVGTLGYCDPLYAETLFLTKESDVYSFGAVLFEVLCGRPCVEMIYKDKRRLLTKLAQKCYDENKLDTIISTSLKEKISPACLERFSKTAYQCLKRERTERPSMTKIVEELEIALEYQEEYEYEIPNIELDEYWRTKLPTNLETIIKRLRIPPSIYFAKKKLFSVLHSGLLFDEDKQFFWISNAGKKCVLISPQRFLSEENFNITWHPRNDSRFLMAVIHNPEISDSLKCHIKASMLSLDTWYTASLVFKLGFLKDIKLIKIKWKTEELNVCATHYAKLMSNNWYSIKMWHFINHMPDAADFTVVIQELSDAESSDLSSFIVQGFEFQPMEMHDDIEEDMDDDDDDDEEHWEEKLPNHYPHFIQMSGEPLEYTTIKELYLRLCEGFLGNHGESRVWLSLCKSTRGMCSMLPATDIIEWDDWDKRHIDTIPLSKSRFHEVIKPTKTNNLYIRCKLESPMFSPHCIYTCYLVFKFQDNQTQPDDYDVSFEASCKLDDIRKGTITISLKLFNIPIIKPTNDYGSHDPSIIPRNERVEMQRTYVANGCSKLDERNDGWMEFMLCKSLHHLQDHKSLQVTLSDKMYKNFNEMIIEGIQFRPVTPCNII